MVSEGEIKPKLSSSAINFVGYRGLDGWSKIAVPTVILAAKPRKSHHEAGLLFASHSPIRLFELINFCLSR